jgi:hypothetical protein
LAIQKQLHSRLKHSYSQSKLKVFVTLRRNFPLLDKFRLFF